jgi:hypothetical protein
MRSGPNSTNEMAVSDRVENTSGWQSKTIARCRLIKMDARNSFSCHL